MPDPNVTAVLRRWSNGESHALDELIPLVYRELQAIAHARLKKERAGQSLQSAELVHEAYLRMVHQPEAEWRDRVHFFAAGSRIIRNILVDHARAKQRARRGGGQEFLTLNESIDASPQRSVAIVALDDALNDLAKLDERQSRIVEMRYFAGLEIEEVAEVLGISRATVNRDWVTARAWLMRQLGPA